MFAQRVQEFALTKRIQERCVRKVFKERMKKCPQEASPRNVLEKRVQALSSRNVSVRQVSCKTCVQEATFTLLQEDIVDFFGRN